MNNTLKLLSGTLCATLLVNCAGFKSNRLPVLKNHDITHSRSSKLKVFIIWQHMDRDVAADSAIVGRINKLTTRYLADALAVARCCVLVNNESESDIKITGNIHNENSRVGYYFGILTGITLGLIPSWANARIHIDFEVFKLGRKSNYDLYDSITMFMWLPMIVVMPFTGNPLVQAREVDENIFKTLIYNMKRDGYI